MNYQRRWAQTLDQTAKMSQRLDNTKWLWCLLALHAGSFWGTTRSVTARTPPSNPSTIEAQAKFFQDFFSVQLSPYKIEFGHVCEDPNTWEQRYEKKDFKNHRDMGKVRWGDKKGGYGEHYWDLNHAGHAGNHGDDNYDGDDGSYHDGNDNDHNSYDDSSNNAPAYGNDDYDPEKSSYEENGRAKRAHPKIKADRKHPKTSGKQYEEESKPQKQSRKHKEQQAEESSREEEYEVDDDDDDEEEEEEHHEKPKPKRKQHRKQEDNPQPKEKNQLVLVVSHKDDAENQPNQYVRNKQPELSPYLPQKQPESSPYLTQKQHELSPYLTQKQPDSSPYLHHNQHEFSQQVPKQQLEPPKYVPYEGGAGVRQHQQPDVSAANTVPRLFLEPSTGHVVDRTTGQAYVLQPIAAHNNYN